VAVLATHLALAVVLATKHNMCIAQIFYSGIHYNNNIIAKITNTPAIYGFVCV
jgi:hypothetical protein